VVAVLGHVDHGKTTLMHSLWNGAVPTSASSAGGITQSIDAYSVALDAAEAAAGKTVRSTFLDTPGHSPFYRLRNESAGLADLVLLVVALAEPKATGAQIGEGGCEQGFSHAGDSSEGGVQSQTAESIGLAEQMGVPVVVAMTKMDLLADADAIDAADATRDPDQQDVGAAGATLLVEAEAQLRSYAFLQDAPMVPVSTRAGYTDSLRQLQMALGTALSAPAVAAEAAVPAPAASPPTARLIASAVVLDASFLQGRGLVFTVLVRHGSLEPGQHFACGMVQAPIRELLQPPTMHAAEQIAVEDGSVLGGGETSGTAVGGGEGMSRKKRKEKKSKKKAKKKQQQQQPVKDGHFSAGGGIKGSNLVNVQRAGAGEVVLVVTGKSVQKKEDSRGGKAKRRKMNRDAPLGQAMLVMEGIQRIVGVEGGGEQAISGYSQQEWATLLVEQRELMLEMEETAVVRVNGEVGSNGTKGTFGGDEDEEYEGEDKLREEADEEGLIHEAGAPVGVRVDDRGNGLDDDLDNTMYLGAYESRKPSLNVHASAIIKAKTASSLATLHDAIESEQEELCHEERVLCGVQVIHLGLGPINESDVALASAARSAGRECQVFGLQVRASAGVDRLARQKNVEIKASKVLPDVLGALRELGERESQAAALRKREHLPADCFG
jgi:translation initiation factor IF-2